MNITDISILEKSSVYQILICPTVYIKTVERKSELFSSHLHKLVMKFYLIFTKVTNTIR